MTMAASPRQYWSPPSVAIGWPKRVMAAVGYKIINKIASVEIPPNTGDFRLMSRRVLEALLSMPEAHRFIRGMVSWIGFTQVPLEYDRQSRYAGETGYTFAKMINFALDAITAFSAKPLRIGLYAGMILVGCVMPFNSNGWSIVNAALFMIIAAEAVHYAVVVFSYRRQA